jgi:aryl-alcohol dehydrogenase-like predicted oxidoreductase
MPLFSWSSLAGGFFSGRFRRDNLDSFSEDRDRLCVTAYCYEENFRRLDRVGELAQAKGVSVTQVALAYVLNQPLNIFALVGCYTPQEFEAGTEAMDLNLTPEELEWLEQKS